MADALVIETSRGEENAVIAVSGEVDLATAPQLEAAIAAVDAGVVVADLTGVTFIDSTGLRVLIGAHEAARDTGGRFAIVVDDGPVTKLFSITGVGDWLDVHDSLAAATAND